MKNLVLSRNREGLCFIVHPLITSCSIKRNNCFMVWAGESSSPGGQGRSNNGLEIGCLVDTTTGLLSFTANGKELSTYYQVSFGDVTQVFTRTNLESFRV